MMLDRRLRELSMTPLSQDAARTEMARLEALAERAYDEMYETRSPAGSFSELKDLFAEAIGVARRAGLTADAERLIKRLEHCRKVYRSQFSSF